MTRSQQQKPPTDDIGKNREALREAFDETVARWQNTNRTPESRRSWSEHGASIALACLVVVSAWAAAIALV